jgi:GT2 family glycosyltransferase
MQFGYKEILEKQKDDKKQATHHNPSRLQNYFESVEYHSATGRTFRTAGVLFLKNAVPQIPTGANFYSVVVPTYNRSQNLKKALISVLNQNIKPDRYEIIVVDDGSDDATRDVVLDLKRLFPDRAIRYFYQENGGPAKARNKGIKEARGDIIFFTDDDCIAPSDWMETLLDALARHPDAAGAGGWIVPPDGELERSATARFFYYHVFFPNSSYGLQRKLYEIKSNHPLMIQDVFAYNTANICFRKKILNKVGGFREVFRAASSEDYDLAFRIVLAGYPLVYIPFHVAHSLDMSLGGFIKHQIRRGANNYLFMALNKNHLEELYPGYVASYGSLSGLFRRLQGPERFLAIAYWLSRKLGILYMKRKIEF